MHRLAIYQSVSQMKLWQAVIVGLLMAALPVLGACSADEPCYSSDEVVVMLTQQLHLVDDGSLEQDRRGAKLVGKPMVTNFKLSDWEAKYLGDGKWQVSAQASYYYQGFSKETSKCNWYFYEKSYIIEYVRNGG